MNFYGKLARFNFFMTYIFSKKVRQGERPETGCGLFWWTFISLVIGIYFIASIWLSIDLVPAMVNEWYGTDFVEHKLSVMEPPMWLVVFLIPAMIISLCLSFVISIIPFMLVTISVIALVFGIFYLVHQYHNKIIPEQVIDLGKATACGTKSIFSKVKCKWYIDYGDE